MLSMLWGDILVSPSSDPLCWARPLPMSLGRGRAWACFSHMGFVTGVLVGLPWPHHPKMEGSLVRRTADTVPSMGLPVCPPMQWVLGERVFGGGWGPSDASPHPLADTGGEGR